MITILKGIRPVYGSQVSNYDFERPERQVILMKMKKQQQQQREMVSKLKMERPMEQFP